MTDNEFNELINALKEKALGNVITTTIEQYKTENGKQQLSDKTIKKIKNDIDTQACIKLIDIEIKRRELEKDNAYENMTDEELKEERKRLLSELAEETN